MTNFKRLLQGVALATIVVAGNAHGQTISTAVVSTGTTTPAATLPVSTTRVVAPAYGNIDPFYKDIGAFWRDINPFTGNIDPFWKDISPFSGTVGAFWGNIDPFYKDIVAFTGETPPDYALVGTFWKDFGATWSLADQQWGAVGYYASDPVKYQQLQQSLLGLVAQSEAVWGTAVTTRTGLSFRTGFADQIFAKYGVDLNNPATFEGMTQSRRVQFFLDWYDGLMDYSGADHVDHWMGTINWSPNITKVQGGGTGTIIGLLDSTVTNYPDIANNVIYNGGYNNPLNGHGTAVASLLVAEHDGRGLMGIAPNAWVAAYNPFDATGTASWDDITAGVLALSAQRASVINMSLGVPGWSVHQDWNMVFANPAVAAATQNTVFVIAAGNDGVAQSTDIAWIWATDPNMIVVGSVNPSGVISGFSNTPGTACLLNNGVCYAQNRLLNRFIVAPGEVILVSDGMGGMIRRSGTSFAAPLVSGTIALLHDRWPWLAQHPDETVEIILRSATDLGAAGPDAVYGRGALNVRASQTPLDFNKLVFYEYRFGKVVPRTVKAIRTAGVRSNWEADGVFFSMFETIGNTKRDFVVPMSSRLIGQKTGAGGSIEYFQNYITSRFIDWIKTGRFTNFSDISTSAVDVGNGLEFAVSASPFLPYADRSAFSGSPHSAISLADRDRGLRLTAGFGQGALAINWTSAATNGATGFGLTSDHSSSTGGVNPVLGFASGGAFGAIGYQIAPDLQLTAGFSANRLVHSQLPGLDHADQIALMGFEPYRANAFNMAIAHQVSPAVSATFSYTRLDEKAAVLGVQSVEPGDLGDGSVTDAATLSATAELGQGLQLSLSATGARTRANGESQAFSTGQGGVLTTAFAVAAAKTGVVGKRDQLRLSIAQPLHIEQGKMEFTSVAVIDRTTGEIGPVTQRFDIAGQSRRYIGEMLYATPVLGSHGELSLFGRAEMNAGSGGADENYIAGGRVRLEF